MDRGKMDTVVLSHYGPPDDAPTPPLTPTGAAIILLL